VTTVGIAAGPATPSAGRGPHGLAPVTSRHSLRLLVVRSLRCPTRPASRASSPRPCWPASTR
jgi:hypothetical protein